MDQRTHDLIERIAREHSHNKFGYLSEEDLRNEIWVICLERLEEFDYTRGELEHYLRRAVKTRLINRFKDITKSVRCPCFRCPEYRKDENPDCNKFGEHKYKCSKWKNYQLSVESRNSLLSVVQPSFDRFGKNDLVEALGVSEIRLFLEQSLSEEFLADFHKIINGTKISRKRINNLKTEIMFLLDSNETLITLKIKGK